MTKHDDTVLAEKFRTLYAHLCRERILPSMPVTEDASPAQMATALRQALCSAYPTTRLKRTMKSIHYANAFADEALKQSAFLLDDIEQYLTRNHFLDHDRSVDFFNEKITAEGFVITPTSLLETMLESLLLSHKGEHNEKNRPQ